MANPNTIPWLNYQDIQVPDATLREQFNGFINAGNYGEALALLKNNKASLEGKAFVAEAIMKIVDGVRFLQGQFNDGVPMFLTDLAAHYFDLVDELGDAGDWVDYIQYEPYNFVKFDGDVYMSISQSKAGEPPAENEYWIKLGLKGEQGAYGVDVNMRYTWNNKQDYKVLDLVVYGSNIYVAVKGNKGVTPGTDEGTWKVFVAVIKGKFNVGVNPPANPEQNTIWFQTTVDPLVDTTGAIGQMNRYTLEGTWEKMYPATFFTLIDGMSAYAPKAYRTKVTLVPEQWRVLNGSYVASYADYRIKQSSIVEGACDSGASIEQYREYSYLGMTVDAGVLKFTMPFKPKNAMMLNINIQ